MTESPAGAFTHAAPRIGARKYAGDSTAWRYRDGAGLVLRGIAHDNGNIVAVTVNDTPAKVETRRSGVVDWSVRLVTPATDLVARSTDEAGNREQTGHRMHVPSVVATSSLREGE